MLSLEEMKANRRKWVEALRSGKYEQGEGCLRDSNGRYCCLGVLTELAGAPYVDFGDGGGFESKQARDFVGLAQTGGYIHQGIASSLWSMNDGGATFAEIADIIESEPKGLFVESVR